MKSIPFNFYSTEMTVRLTTAETGGAYCAIEMLHAANVGPARHIHPRGPESFIVLEGDYTFDAAGEQTTLSAGGAITIPPNTPHRYQTGAKGGRLLVICPPDLENYFWQTAQRLQADGISLEEEFALATKYGQNFVERTGHWGHATPPSPQ